MKKQVRLLLFGGHVICVLKSDMESANEFRNSILNMVVDSLKSKQTRFIDFTEFSFRSDCLEGVDIADYEQSVGERIVKNQEEILDVFKRQVGEGEDWRTEDDE